MFEHRIDFGPGYGIYFGKDGETLIILSGEGTKTSKPHEVTGRTTNGANDRRLESHGSDT